MYGFERVLSEEHQLRSLDHASGQEGESMGREIQVCHHITAKEQNKILYI